MDSVLHERLQSVAGDTTYRRLGEMTSTNHETVRRYMHGQPPSAEFLSHFCNAMGVNGDWLLTGRGPMRVTEIREHALTQADPSELLTAIANTLELVLSRVERLELFVQTMETRIRVGRGKGSGDQDERAGVGARAVEIGRAIVGESRAEPSR